MSRKKIIGWYLLAVFLLTLIQPFYPYIEYALRKSYIIKYLCINRDKPELECNGQCHVNRQIQQGQAEKNESTGRPALRPVSENEYRLPDVLTMVSVPPEQKRKLFSSDTHPGLNFHGKVPTPPPESIC